MAPFLSRAATSASITGSFAPCNGVEKRAPGNARGGEDVKGGWYPSTAWKDEGTSPILPSKKGGSGAVCYRPPDGRGQIKRESWQGEASGLGTLSLGPPSLPPLTDSLLLLALPLLGGRAVRFSRGPVAGTALQLFVRSRLPLRPNLELLWTGAGVGVRGAWSGRGRPDTTVASLLPRPP
jgi:hypothetical protein